MLVSRKPVESVGFPKSRQNQENPQNQEYPKNLENPQNEEYPQNLENLEMTPSPTQDKSDLVNFLLDTYIHTDRQTDIPF